jgi:hypothetical protein
MAWTNSDGRRPLDGQRHNIIAPSEDGRIRIKMMDLDEIVLNSLRSIKINFVQVCSLIVNMNSQWTFLVSFFSPTLEIAYFIINVKLIRYQLWCTRCAFRLLKSFQLYWGRKSWKSEKKRIVKTAQEPKKNTVPWNWTKSVEG